MVFGDFVVAFLLVDGEETEAESRCKATTPAAHPTPEHPEATPTPKSSDFKRQNSKPKAPRQTSTDLVCNPKP